MLRAIRWEKVIGSGCGPVPGAVCGTTGLYAVWSGAVTDTSLRSSIIPKDGGVKISEWYDFAGVEFIVYLVARPSSPEHANDIVARGEANLGTPYIFFSRNCEHFASFCFTGEAKSETMEGFGTIALYSAGAFVVAKFIDSVTQKPRSRR